VTRVALLAVLLLGCGQATTLTPSDMEGDGCASGRLEDPAGRTYYHASTHTVDESYPTRADVETTYHTALARLGGCPYYYFLDEWCEAPTECRRENVWWIALWEGVDTCADLYWSRGAYCRGVRE
jgi:hypothetical protein